MGASLDGLVDELRDAARELDAAVWSSGLQGRFTSTYRSHSEQERLYRAYIAGRHPFPVAAPGTSAHEYGEAFDYLVTPSEYQRDVGLTWVSWGGEWGGSADVVHFELPGASARAIAAAKSLGVTIDQKYNDLPWWATLALPTSVMTTDRTPAEQERLAHPLDWACKRYGWFC
jgi:hypothetical protein